jgi:hypothetical protein
VEEGKKIIELLTDIRSLLIVIVDAIDSDDKPDTEAGYLDGSKD